MSTSLLPPNSERVATHLGGYNCAICHLQLILWEYVQTTTLKSQRNELGCTKDVNTQRNELGGTKDVNTQMNELGGTKDANTQLNELGGTKDVNTQMN